MSKTCKATYTTDKKDVLYCATCRNRIHVHQEIVHTIKTNSSTEIPQSALGYQHIELICPVCGSFVMYEVDPMVFETVDYLNTNGIQTTGSCEGHIDTTYISEFTDFGEEWAYNAPWIDIALTDENRDTLLRAIKEAAKHKSLSSRSSNRYTELSPDTIRITCFTDDLDSSDVVRTSDGKYHYEAIQTSRKRLKALNASLMEYAKYIVDNMFLGITNSIEE